MPESADDQAPPPFAPDAVPSHIAVIMDGNGRWARERGLPRVKGHEAGAESVRACVRACGEWGVKVLSLYAFSTENWQRPRAEVQALMRLLGRYLREERPELQAQNVRLRPIGDLARLPRGARQELERTREALAGNSGLTLVLALSYGGRDEILRACRRLAARAAAGEVRPEAIDPDAFAAALDTAGLPDPELLIRTAGEMRISNFLLWQASYAEYYSAPVCWPDFGRAELAAAIAEYQRRRRTFGRVTEE
jgi:undecaprenyl diphosphate synthase